jgi:hypothetical protein
VEVLKSLSAIDETSITDEGFVEKIVKKAGEQREGRER